MKWNTDLENVKDGKYYLFCNMDSPIKECVVGSWFPKSKMFLIRYTDIQVTPTHWSKIDLPDSVEAIDQAENNRIIYDIDNYLSFCIYSCAYLNEQAKTLDKEEAEIAHADSSAYLNTATALNNIINNSCLRYDKLTKESVEEMWKKNLGRYMFSSVPIEYKQ